jgi:hypothetical protein
MNDVPIAPEPALLTRIARELATEQYTLEQILQRYQLEQDYYDTQIAPNPFFQLVLADYTKEWHSPKTTKERLSFYAGLALEEHLAGIAERMGSRASELSDVVATAKLFKELAGIAPPVAASANPGERFSININFGHHKVALETTPVVEVETTPTLEAPKKDDV